jgi:hypothetical protein
LDIPHPLLGQNGKGSSAMKTKPPPENPTPEMIQRGLKVYETNPSGPLDILIHDIWQAMYDEWKYQNRPGVIVDLNNLK